MLGAQAAGAQVEPFHPAVYVYRRRVNIGQKAAVSVALGVADIMAELG